MNYYESPYSSIPTVIKNILIINIIMFIATLVNQNFMISTFALFYPTTPWFHWWQPITYMFMHGGFWHIFFNMYTLFCFGCIVENIIGSKKFLIFYFVCGLGAAALHLALQSMGSINSQMTPTVGASGAIYGVIIAYAMLFPEAKLTLLFPPITLSAKWMAVAFIAIELFTGVTGTVEGVAHFAHLGGMLFGWLLILYWKKKGTLFNRN